MAILKQRFCKTCGASKLHKFTSCFSTLHSCDFWECARCRTRQYRCPACKEFAASEKGGLCPACARSGSLRAV